MEKQIELIDIKRADQEGPECSEEILREIRKENRKQEKIKDATVAFACIAVIASVFSLGLVLGRCLTFLTAMGF